MAGSREMVKACGLASRMRVRDYYGTIVEDDHLKILKDMVDVEKGDSFMIITFHDPNDTKEKQKRRRKRLLNKFNKQRKKR